MPNRLWYWAARLLRPQADSSMACAIVTAAGTPKRCCAATAPGATRLMNACWSLVPGVAYVRPAWLDAVGAAVAAGVAAGDDAGGVLAGAAAGVAAGDDAGGVLAGVAAVEAPGAARSSGPAAGSIASVPAGRPGTVACPAVTRAPPETAGTIASVPAGTPGTLACPAFTVAPAGDGPAAARVVLPAVTREPAPVLPVKAPIPGTPGTSAVPAGCAGFLSPPGAAPPLPPLDVPLVMPSPGVAPGAAGLPVVLAVVAGPAVSRPLSTKPVTPCSASGPRNEWALTVSPGSESAPIVSSTPSA
jgi:hypothetical protein